MPRELTPLEFLLTAMNDEKLDANTRIRAAVAAAQYVHVKTHDGGQKEKRQKVADEAGVGQFAPSDAPPIRDPLH